MEYFEAKLYRAFPVSEALAYVVPDNLDENLKKNLKAAGGNVIEYKAEDMDDRLKKINGIEGARFSQEDKEFRSNFGESNMEVDLGVKLPKSSSDFLTAHIVSLAMNNPHIATGGVEGYTNDENFYYLFDVTDNGGIVLKKVIDTQEFNLKEEAFDEGYFEENRGDFKGERNLTRGRKTYSTPTGYGRTLRESLELVERTLKGNVQGSDGRGKTDFDYTTLNKRNIDGIYGPYNEDGSFTKDAAETFKTYGISLDDPNTDYVESYLDYSRYSTEDSGGNTLTSQQQEDDYIRYSREMDEQAKVNFGSMFSGTVTVDFALRNMVNHRFAVEYDRQIAGVFKSNNGEEIFIGDVRDAVKQGYLDDKDVEYFHASPVCKNFSSQKHDSGEQPLDISTAQAVADAIDSLGPKIFTLENVKGFGRRSLNAFDAYTDP